MSLFCFVGLFMTNIHMPRAFRSVVSRHCSISTKKMVNTLETHNNLSSRSSLISFNAYMWCDPKMNQIGVAPLNVLTQKFAFFTSSSHNNKTIKIYVHILALCWPPLPHIRFVCKLLLWTLSESTESECCASNEKLPLISLLSHIFSLT